MAPKAVHFGGGNISRCFIAEKLSLAGFEVVSNLSHQVVFLDVNGSLTKKLQNTPKYMVTKIGTEGTKAIEISNYRAINFKSNESDVIKEIATAEMVRQTFRLCIQLIVGPNILKLVAPVIAKAIDARTDLPPLAVIALREHDWSYR